MPEIIGQCPVCGEGLKVTRLVCPSCETGIDGSFQPCRFCRLDKEQRRFAETFIKCRGNIREVERELGISYPTVRGRLELLLESMGFGENRTEDAPPPVQHRKEGLDALERLDKGEINVDEALDLIRRGRR